MMPALTVEFIKGSWKAAAQGFGEHMAKRPDGFVKARWAEEFPGAGRVKLHARDTNFKSRPERLLYCEDGRQVSVWSMGRKARLIEWIDLKSDNASARLARYETAD